MPAIAAGSLIIILTALVAMGMVTLTHSGNTGLSAWLASKLQRLPVVGGWTAAEVLKLDRWIVHTIGGHGFQVMHRAVAFFAGLRQYVELVGVSSLAWPWELSRFAYWLVRHEIPHLIRHLPNSVTRVIHATTARVKTVERTIVHTTKVITAKATTVVVHTFPARIRADLHLLEWLRAHIRALTVAIAHAPTIPFGRTIGGIRARLRRLERLSAGTLALGVVLTALGRLGLGWLRCGNVRNAGKRVCGMNLGLLESLLLDTVAIFGIVSVVEFARDLRSIEDEAAKIMGVLIREWPSA